MCRQPFSGGVEGTVSRNGCLRTMSGGKPSSIKWEVPCAAGKLFLSRMGDQRAYCVYQRSVCGPAMRRSFFSSRLIGFRAVSRRIIFRCFAPKMLGNTPSIPCAFQRAQRKILSPCYPPQTERRLHGGTSGSRWIISCRTHQRKGEVGNVSGLIQKMASQNF